VADEDRIVRFKVALPDQAARPASGYGSADQAQQKGLVHQKDAALRWQRHGPDRTRCLHARPTARLTLRSAPIASSDHRFSCASAPSSVRVSATSAAVPAQAHHIVTHCGRHAVIPNIWNAIEHTFTGAHGRAAQVSAELAVTSQAPVRHAMARAHRSAARD